MNILKKSVVNLVGSPIGLSPDDGERVFHVIQRSLAAGQVVELSFLNMEIMTPAFLNTAFGQLYRDFTEAELMTQLILMDMSAEDSTLLDRVVAAAKLFYSDPDRLGASIRLIMEEIELTKGK